MLVGRGLCDLAQKGIKAAEIAAAPSCSGAPVFCDSPPIFEKRPLNFHLTAARNLLCTRSACMHAKRVHRARAMRTITYDELTGGLIPRALIDKLAKAGELDDATFRRINHLADFFLAIHRKAEKLQISDDEPIRNHLTEADLQRIWQHTAAAGDTEKPSRPLMDCVLQR